MERSGLQAGPSALPSLTSMVNGHGDGKSPSSAISQIKSVMPMLTSETLGQRPTRSRLDGVVFSKMSFWMEGNNGVVLLAYFGARNEFQGRNRISLRV